MKFECLSSDCSCNSYQILIDDFIHDVTIKKKTMDSEMESVTRLMRQVEYEEKAAENAKEEADRCSLRILAKVDQLKQARLRAKETNDMLAREAYVQKDLLATKSDVLQLQAARLLDNGDRSLDLLNEMHKTLKKRLTSALLVKEIANKKKQENEASARAALSYEKKQMKTVGKEFKRLKQEAVEISKLQEFFIDRGHVIHMLRAEISEKCQDVKLLKDKMDQAILLGGITSSSRKSSIFASSSSSSVSSKVHCQPNTHLKSVDLRPNEVFDGINILNGAEDITRSIKKWKAKGELRGKGMFARSIKKVRIKGKLYGSRLFAKRVKKVKVKGKLRGNLMCIKRIKEVRIKGKLFGSRLFAKRVEKVKVKGKLSENLMCTKRIKKVKIKGKLYGSRMCAKSRKKVNIIGKLHGSRMCAKSTKKAKIRAKLCVTRMFAKSIKKVKIKGQSASKSNVRLKNQQVKIKGLRVVSQKVQQQIT